MDEELFAAGSAGGSGGVRAWLAERMEGLGDRFVMPEFEILVVGHRLRSAGHVGAAHEVFDILIERFPSSGSPSHAKGFTYETQGKMARAAALYQKALRIGTQQGEQDFMLNRYREASTLRSTAQDRQSECSRCVGREGPPPPIRGREGERSPTGGRVTPLNRRML